MFEQLSRGFIDNMADNLSGAFWGVVPRYLRGQEAYQWVLDNAHKLQTMDGLWDGAFRRLRRLDKENALFYDFLLTLSDSDSVYWIAATGALSDLSRAAIDQAVQVLIAEASRGATNDN